MLCRLVDLKSELTELSGGAMGSKPAGSSSWAGSTPLGVLKQQLLSDKLPHKGAGKGL